MSGNVQICDIDAELKKQLKDFRLRKEKNCAGLILKVVPEKLLVILDEKHENISVDDLQEELPEHLPRYVVYSYVYKHDDGRVSYPLCFIFISPAGTKPELQMMYAGTKNKLVNELGLTKEHLLRKKDGFERLSFLLEVFELRSVEEFTEEWLKSKLAFFR